MRNNDFILDLESFLKFCLGRIHFCQIKEKVGAKTNIRDRNVCKFKHDVDYLKGTNKIGDNVCIQMNESDMFLSRL